jgi:hypothetical protein
MTTVKDLPRRPAYTAQPVKQRLPRLAQHLFLDRHRLVERLEILLSTLGDDDLDGRGGGRLRCPLNLPWSANEYKRCTGGERAYRLRAFIVSRDGPSSSSSSDSPAASCDGAGAFDGVSRFAEPTFGAEGFAFACFAGVGSSIVDEIGMVRYSSRHMFKSIFTKGET